MELRNNNREIISILAKAGYKNSKSRNRLMIGAAALTVIIIFSIFTIMKGRIDAEYLAEVRHNGNDAATWLEDPTPEQTAKIKNLYYIKDAAAVKYFATGKVDGQNIFICAAAEKYAYQNIYRPAYTDIYGHYPKKDNEVMLPVRALEEMRIQTPKLGMTVDLEIYMDKNKSDKQTFTLSGYYTEYVHPIEGAPIGFFAEGYLNKLGFNMDQPTYLLIRQNNLFTGENIKEMLYRDIETVSDTQRFDSENSVNYYVIRRTVGGYDIAALCILLIVICVFLLNYNVMNISLTRDIRHYGLMKTLGATSRQIRKTIYVQILKISISGIIIGSLISLVVVLLILPKILAGYYLNNYGLSSSMMTFSPVLLLISAVLSLLFSFISILGPAWKAAKIAPVESLKYIGSKVNSTKQKVKKKQYKNGSSILQMAWRNLFRNKRNTWITILSLFLGFSTALCSLVVVRGLDITNNFELFPDFRLDVFYNPQWAENYDRTFMPVTLEDIEYFNSLTGVDEVSVIYGDHVLLDSATRVWQPFLKGNILLEEQQDGYDDSEHAEYVRKEFYSTVIVADDVYIRELEQYVQENQIPIDMESFKNGTGIISTSGGMFSQKVLDASASVIGESFELQRNDNETVDSLTFAGYLDVTKEACPQKHLPFKLNGPELMMSEKAFANAGLTKKPITAEIYTDPAKESFIKNRVKALMEKKTNALPPSEQDSKLPSVRVNSDSLKAAQDEIKTIQTVMYTISLLLILLGLFNYFNATAANLLNRRNEIAVMESIGITRKQLRTMLTAEGLYFSAIISTLMISAGSGLLFLLFHVLKSRLGYAKFFFPYGGLAVIIVLIFAICMMVPLIMYRQITSESVIERLRLNGE